MLGLNRKRLARRSVVVVALLLVGLVGSAAPAAAAPPDMAVCTSQPGTYMRIGEAYVDAVACYAADGGSAIAIARAGGMAYAHSDGAGNRTTAIATGDTALASVTAVGTGNHLTAMATGYSNATVDVTGSNNTALAKASSSDENARAFARVLIADGCSGYTERAFAGTGETTDLTFCYSP